MLLLLSSLSSAAIVNVLQPAVGPPELGNSGSLSLSARVLQGNETRLSATGAAGFRHVSEAHLVRVQISGERAMAFDEVLADKAFAHLRHVWTFHDPFATFAFVQSDRNAFRSLQLRSLAGGGVQARLWRNDWTEAAFGVGAMAEYQLLSEGAVDSDAGLHPRGTSFLTMAISRDGKISLASTSFFQPRLDDLSNWRFLEELALTVDVTRRVDWTLVAKLELDSQPVPGNEGYDLSLVNGLVFSF
jgi:hypothetical protein